MILADCRETQLFRDNFPELHTEIPDKSLPSYYLIANVTKENRKLFDEIFRSRNYFPRIPDTYKHYLTTGPAQF